MEAGRHVPGTGFWNGASTLKQYFVLPKNGSKYYLKYTFLAFPVLGILGLGTSLEAGASGVPQDLGKLRGHARRRARPSRRAGEKDGSGIESKRARLPEYSPTGRDR